MEQKYLDPQLRSFIDLMATAGAFNIINIKTGDITINNFNFYDCNLQLQGDLNSLVRSLSEGGHEAEAKNLKSVLSDLEELEKINDRDKVIKSGLLVRLTNFLKELGDDNSSTNKVIKGIKNCKEIVSQIVKKYSTIAEWAGIPPVIDFILK